MSNQRPIRADVQALSGLLRQFENELKDQGRTEERGIVLDALRKLAASPASLRAEISEIPVEQRSNRTTSTEHNKISNG